MREWYWRFLVNLGQLYKTAWKNGTKGFWLKCYQLWWRREKEKKKENHTACLHGVIKSINIEHTLASILITGTVLSSYHRGLWNGKLNESEVSCLRFMKGHLLEWYWFLHSLFNTFMIPLKSHITLSRYYAKRNAVEWATEFCIHVEGLAGKLTLRHSAGWPGIELWLITI